MRKDWIECEYQDLLDYEQPTNYIVDNTNYKDEYKTPVLTAGKSFIKGYTNETDGIFENLPVIIFDDFTTASKYVNFKFKVKSSAMKILNPTCDLVHMKFAFLHMQIDKEQIDTHKRFWISKFSKKKLPLPPLPEQKAIVTKIENLFSDLDNGIANLKKAQEQLKTYRQAVLKKAFEGELTKKWREKQVDLLQATIEFVKQLNSSVDLAKTNSTDWIECCFEDVLDYEQPTPYIVKSTKYNDTYKTPVLTAGKTFIKGYTNEQDGIFNNLPAIIFDDFTTASQFVNFKFKVKSSAMKILVPANKNINIKFTFYCMQVNKMRHDTHKRYWISVFAKKKFFIPSTQEQNQIVQEIETRLSVCDKVEANIKEALKKSESLRQSILKKAFEGKLLTESELEEVRNDPEWEPAEKLLERIKAEKAEASKQKRKKR